MVLFVNVEGQMFEGGGAGVVLKAGTLEFLFPWAEGVGFQRRDERTSLARS